MLPYKAVVIFLLWTWCRTNPGNFEFLPLKLHLKIIFLHCEGLNASLSPGLNAIFTLYFYNI